LLHEATKLRITPIEHFNSILSEKSPYEYEYKFVNFDLMGTDHKTWGEQLRNDLENLYINEGLQLIGGYSTVNSLSEFTLVMYKLSDQARLNAFDLELKVIYGQIPQKDFEKYLNDQFRENKLMYKCIFTIYQIDRDSILEGNTQVYMNLVIFQKMTVNYIEYNEKFTFSVMTIPTFSKKHDPEVTLLSKLLISLKKEQIIICL